MTGYAMFAGTRVLTCALGKMAGSPAGGGVVKTCAGSLGARLPLV
ncbi:MAG: hypothetical protein OEZ32_04400 [Nitrospinota bacterium]|nr:hypothetical protein [Nitrospinota bacterium]